MRYLVGIILTFTRFVPDGAGMAKVEKEWWLGRSVARAVSLSLKPESIRRIQEIEIDNKLRIERDSFGPHQI